ncbi:hypothetical protein KP509_16G073700 [Ceratopteris richardii]|uniref:GCK domain-containing protein n=1 Tax=Ceratopteris richardii TaxID=49495 RepID=A0A8T2SZW8_CERRI|nr:hypothetical protein KP509_16G073700 [Ceratopteris richardii]KAH7388391.1 hypothetical protein KP509_16G073700 [Ceratopteris richardii]
MAGVISSELPSKQSRLTAEEIGASENKSHTEVSPQNVARDSAKSKQDDVEAGDSSVSVDIEGTHEEEGEGREEGGEDDDDDEEAGECGFCLFMKSGPCRDSFIKWEECVEQAEKDKEDIVEKCHKVTFFLKECMEKNSDYYDPVLQAEKALDEEVESENSTVETSKQDADERRSSSPTDSSDPSLPKGE